MNAGIQGLAADIFKVALVRLDEALRGRDAGQPHHPASARRGARRTAAAGTRRAAALTAEVMAGAAELRVPLAVNLSFGETWADAKGLTGSEPDHWFEPLADHLGAAYLRYSFTKGTDRRSRSSSTRSTLRPGSGCSTSVAAPAPRAGARGAGDRSGRHRHRARFIDIATRAHACGRAGHVPADGRACAAVRPGVRCRSLVVPGAFGLVGPGADLDVLRRHRPRARAGRTVRDQRVLVVLPGEVPAGAGQLRRRHRRASRTDRHQGRGRHEAEVDLWTTCYTARELALLVERAGLVVDARLVGRPRALRAARADHRDRRNSSSSDEPRHTSPDRTATALA